jgi:hypothetical protein
MKGIDSVSPKETQRLRLGQRRFFLVTEISSHFWHP